jgi:hypothetical protein
MKLRIALAVLLFTPALAAAQSAVELPPIRIDFPLVDLPYNSEHGYRAPSMPQALSLSEGFYEGTHRAIERAFGRRVWLSRFAIIGADLLDTLIVPLPGSDGWLHEEYHRTVLGRRGAGSFNDIYKFRIAADSISVSHVDDADLIRLKRDHPAEQVRLSAAGIEGEYQLVQGLEKREFFDRARSFNQPLYWLEKLGAITYVMSGTSADTNTETDDMNRRETTIPVRDFTGHDFTAWVYDLHRPAEAYAARGLHPSGVGIDRYITPSDLTTEEISCLRHQGRLQLLNLVDPFLAGLHDITVTFHGAPLRLNANLGHVLTPFGRTIDTNVFLARGSVKMLLTAHAYANGERSFPGIEAALVDYPVRVHGHTVNVSPRIALWQQPEGQLFRATDGATGGLFAVKVQRPGKGRLGAFAEVEAKTAGWVAGSVALDRDVSVRVGLSLMLR